MAIPAELESLSSNDPDGSIWKGAHREIISGVANTTTAFQLTPAQSGALCLHDAADGSVYTLPGAPSAGQWFEFLVTVAVTSNAAKILTKTIASEFLVGGIIMGDVTVATSGDYFEADGTTIAALSAAGTTTGGLLGERYKVVAISATQWAIDGVCHGAGTLATPFATT